MSVRNAASARSDSAPRPPSDSGIASYYPAMDFDLSVDQAPSRGGRRFLDGHSDPRRCGHCDAAPSTRALDRHGRAGWPGWPSRGRGGLGLGWVRRPCCSRSRPSHRTGAVRPQLLALDVLATATRTPVWSPRSSTAPSPRPCLVGPGRRGGLRRRRDAVTLTGRLGPVEGAAVADVAVVVVPTASSCRPDRNGASRSRARHGRHPEPVVARPRRHAGRPPRWGRGVGRLVRSGPGDVRRAARGAGRVLELATDYAKDRVQFGAPRQLPGRQAPVRRHAVDVEGMRSPRGTRPGPPRSRAGLGDGGSTAKSGAPTPPSG